MIKENYITNQNHEEKVLQWKIELKKIRDYKKLNFQIEQSALLVLDMQKIFLDSSSHAYIPSSKLILSNINKLIEFYEKKQLPIYYTRHISHLCENDLMRRWWKSPILVENVNSALSSDLLIKHGEIIIKNYYSAFFKTKLTEKLHNLNISQLVITGVMSHLCCESTAREGFMNNFEIFYVTDGTATYNELLHKGTMFSLAHGFAECLTAKDILGD